MKRKLIRLLGVLFAVSIFLLPLKFGTLAVMTEAAGYFPPELWQWLFISYPAHALGLLGAFLLAGCMLLLPPPALCGGAGATALLWCVCLPLGACIGLGRGVYEIGFAQLAHLCGVAVFLFAVFWFLSAEPGWKKVFGNVLCVSALLVGISAFRQFFFGMDEMREFLAAQYASGIAVSKAMQAKVNDPRVYATFTSCNALGCFVLMALPLVLYCCRRWGEYFEPVKVSRILFCVLAGGLLAGTLLLTRGRSALLVAALLMLTAVFSLPPLPRKWRWAGVAAAILLMAGGLVFSLQKNRGLGSFVERIDYLRTCSILVAEKPLAGHGWGGFFLRHMQLKQSRTDEAARDPHNFICSFAAAAGVPAALFAAAALLLPLVLLWKSRFDGLRGVCFWGGAGFVLHSLLDSDLQISALPVLAGSFFLMALLSDTVSGEETRKWRFAAYGIAGALLVSACFLNITVLRGEVAFARLTERLQPSSADAIPDWRPPEQFFAEIHALRPRASLFWELEGDWRLSVSDFAGARRAYQTAWELDPRRPGTCRRIAEWELRQGNRENAAMWIRRAHELFPRNPQYDPELFLAE